MSLILLKGRNGMKKMILIFYFFVFLLNPLCSFANNKDLSFWYFGFGIGTGNGSYKTDSGTITYEEHFEPNDSLTPRLSFQIAAGIIMTRNFLLGIDVSFLYQEGKRSYSDLDLQMVNYTTFTLTYLPYEKGLFFKTGVGPGVMYYDSEAAYGFSLMGGLGMLFQAGKNFHFSTHFEYTYHNYDTFSSTGPKSSHFWAAYLSIYFLGSSTLIKKFQDDVSIIPE